MVHNINILLVDDVHITLESSAYSLKRYFNVFTALNGMEAWNVLESQRIDCLITNVNMPVMNGVELLKRVQKNNYYIETIMVSGVYDLSIEEEFAGLNVDAYITKPYVVGGITGRIKTLLERQYLELI